MLGAVYTFRCPVCGKDFRSDEPGEPCCTGPSETRDDHEMTVMRLHSVGYREIAPAYAEQRAGGVLLTPDLQREVARELRVLKV